MPVVTAKAPRWSGRPVSFGRDEVGEGAAGLGAFAVGLLAEEVEDWRGLGAGLVGVESDDVVAKWRWRGRSRRRRGR